jgi:hypothetical protein
MPVSPRIAANRQARHDARMAHAAEVVPHGMYCYVPTGPMAERVMPDGTTRISMPTKTCPFWARNGMKREQEDGYCRLIKKGDWMPNPHGTMLLWDQVKECGVNADFSEDAEGIDAWKRDGGFPAEEG